MKKSFHYMLMANQAMVHKLLLAGLEDTELTLGQPKILDFLRDHDGVSQKEIATGCHIEAPSLTSILFRMEANGLIERRMLNGNRRSLYVFLTDKGRKDMARVAEEFEAIEKKAFLGIEDSERDSFLKCFEKIYENLYREKEDLSWKE